MAKILDIIPEWGTFIFCLVEENVPSKTLHEIQKDLLFDDNFSMLTKEETFEEVKNYLQGKLDLDTYLLIIGKIERGEMTFKNIRF